ncbi:hypothetical protein M9H77_18472 [Catharanthus roseus]|uniref:Uncharacterized protein n=1 Tax=Catharanthus roseus TaxID=4058 RepID=A0ACC0B7L7_CATRO|nr:hypothetical protein M9H77_18472 [Catharanthus roseus]
MRRSCLSVGHCLRHGYLYFPLFAPAVRPGAKLCKPYIQRFAMLGHKLEHKLVDFHIRLDMMTADEVKWTPYSPEEKRMFSVPVVRPSRYTDDYMAWFLSRTHPRIQNPERLSLGVQLPTATLISEKVLLDMITYEVDWDDVDSETKIRRISDMLRKYNHPHP